ncbi:hydroxyacid dehydrogenase [soil metagenome]
MIGMTNAVFFGVAGALDKAYPSGLREELAKDFAFPVPAVTKETVMDADLRGVEVLFGTWGMKVFDREFLEAAPDLKAVFYAAGTVKEFATREAYDRGITICGAWRANAIPVAEYTISVILLSLKKFWQASREIRQRKVMGPEIDVPGCFRTKVGLVSLGAIGMKVAELLRAFDVEVMAYDPYCDPEHARQAGVKLITLEEVFRECDVVSVHVPLLSQTLKMIDGTLVNSMKEGATLINTARGAVLDEESVLEIFRERTDLTAVLDVTVTEPPAKESLVYTLENVIYTPHIAGSMGSEIARMGYWMAEEAQRYLAGEPLKHQITFDMLGSVA